MTCDTYILVVDDDPSTRDMIELALSDEGYPVVTAANGSAALDAVAARRPGLILLNLRMPVLDGQGFWERYRARPGPHAPIVIISAVHGVEDQAARVDATGILRKPFDLDELLAIVRANTG